MIRWSTLVFAAASVLGVAASAWAQAGPPGDATAPAAPEATEPEGADATGAEAETAGADDTEEAEPEAAEEPAATLPEAPDDTAEAPGPGDRSLASDEAVKGDGTGAGDGAAEEEEMYLPEGEQAPIGADGKRVLPDYDGRGEEPITAGEVLIWIPRGLFYPVYLVAEYGLRWPLGKLTAAAEANDVPAILEDFLTFGPENNYGLIPSGLIDFGFRPSIGLYFFGNDVGGVEGLGVRSHGAFGGIGFYRLTGAVRYQFSEEGVDSYARHMQVKGVYNRRPDQLFWGTGANTNDDLRTRYTVQEIEAIATYEGGFWRSSFLGASLGVRDVTFTDQACCGEQPLGFGIQQGWFGKPDLYDDGYLIGHASGELRLDTRKRRNVFEGKATDHVSPSGTGVKLDLRGTLGVGLRESFLNDSLVERTRPAFARYGGTLGGFVDIYNQRVVGLQATLDFADPLDGKRQVPFRELASLGGSRPLRGFLQNRFLGRSAASATIEYRWPIWVWLDGTLHYAVGNVFDKHLEDFQLALLRQSFGLGFRGTSSRDHAFEFLVGGGTDTFADGSSLESFRLVFGSTAGF